MAKLKLPQIFVEFEVRDKEGKLIQKGRFKAESWVGRIIEVLRSMLATYGSASAIYVIGGSTEVTCVSTSKAQINTQVASGQSGGGLAPSGNDVCGILIGDSDAAVTLAQINLQSKIANSVMSHGSTTTETITIDTTYYFRVIRTFTNVSGSTKTVREFGLFIGARLTTDAFMLARDVPPSAITVPNGSTLTLRYIISHSLA